MSLVLRVPTSNRCIASHRGAGVYAYDRKGGMSWAAPFIAGVAALGYQLDPTLTPNAIRALLVKTATVTKAGPAINPRAFLARVRDR